jgi:hypothetical protein
MGEKINRNAHRSSRLRQIYSAVHWPAKPRLTIYESRRGHARNRRQPKSGAFEVDDGGWSERSTCGSSI